MIGKKQVLFWALGVSVGLVLVIILSMIAYTPRLYSTIPEETTQTTTQDATSLQISTPSTTVITEPEDVHYHAGFQVYLDNRLINFAQPEYMYFATCDEDGHPTRDSFESEEAWQDYLQLQKAHLHALVGDVVHVHTTGATWQDLFTNLNYTFPNDEPVVGYINGVLVDEDLLAQPITAYDSVVILVGDTDDIPGKVSTSVSRERIIEVEQTIDGC